jgi:hypothetical protein
MTKETYVVSNSVEALLESISRVIGTITYKSDYSFKVYKSYIKPHKGLGTDQ